MESAMLETQLKKTVAPNKIRECLLDDEYMSDVTFLLGSEETQLKAHKMFLATSSPILLQLFENNFDEQTNVRISSVTKPAMLEVCRYAYTDSPNLTQTNVLDVLFAASKFEMRSLIEKCVDFTGKLLSDRNVFKFLVENQKHNNFRVNMKCFEFVEKNHQKCFKNGEFVKLPADILRTLVTTCKIQREALVNAISMWTQFNHTADMDELMALVPQAKPEPTKVINNQQRTRSRSRSKVSANNQLSFNQHSSGLCELSIHGGTAMKNFKYANLDLLVNGSKIIMREIHFIYDLKLFDEHEQFEITISEVDGKNRNKLYSNVVAIDSCFTVYRLTREVELQPNSKIWVNVEFPTSTFRLSFDDFHATNAHRLILRKDTSYNSYAQIISKVIYTTVD